MLSSRPFFRRPLSVSVSAVFLAAVWIVPPACAETWNSGAGSTWNSTANWTPSSIPNSVGATAIFNTAASVNNAAQTANRTITLDGPQTVGAILFNNDAGSVTNSLTVGTGGSLIFDQTGTGPATINVPLAGGSGNNTISAPITLNDTLFATVDNTAAGSAAGALNLTATMSGTGGFIKAGDGLATFGTGAKTYTGPTSLNGGRMRISLTASPTATSSFTINSGGQLDLITATGPFTFGPGPLNLNGAGPISGPFAAFPGAIRADTNLSVTITNPVVLQTDTLLHTQGAASGMLAFTSSISGQGGLTFTAPNSNADIGVLNLSATNTYSGGTTINGGTLILSASVATLGIGNVLVQDLSTTTGSFGKLTIQSGVLDAISNTATLSLAGGKLAGFADDGYVELQSGVNEIVGQLILGTLSQIPGTYGSSVSTALFKNDEYFSGPGVVTVIPEPSTSLLVLASGAPLLFARRRSARPL